MTASAQHPAGARLPDFYIVGHAKSGTTALYEMLGRHPQIHAPAKEPRFFAIEDVDVQWDALDDDALAAMLAALSPQPEDTGRRPRTLAGYAALFAGARPEQLIGEASPAYLRSPLVAGRIARLRPDARIIAILREPVSFLRSFHLQSLRGYNESERDFAKAIELVEERRQGRQLPHLARTPADLLYTDHVRYVEQLRRYHEHFPREQMLVLIYEDFQRDNEATVREVLRFLQVDDSVPVEAVRTGPSRDVRHPRLHVLVNLRRAALRNVKAAGAASRAFNSLTPAPLRGTLKSRWRRAAYDRPAPPDERFALELRRRLKPEVQALSEYLGRDLVGLWGYDQID
ncbi:MAG TPA: sulfotransferase [Solirubrobacteraceae bacterium]|nr:sulfotransferase [Solirubrobacteraceae bacterium]